MSTALRCLRARGARPRMACCPRDAAMNRSLLVLLLALTGCGLFFPPDPIDFRPYTLEDVSYEQAVDLVQGVVVKEFQQRFGGGFETDWEPGTGNFTVSGVQDGNRGLTLYVKLVSQGADTVVEMLAVVRGVNLGGVPGQAYVEPQQDVYLEELLYDAMVLEAVNRRADNT